MQYFLLLSPASQFSGFCETSNGLFMQKILKLEFIQNLNFRLSIQNKVQLWPLLIKHLSYSFYLSPKLSTELAKIGHIFRKQSK